MRRTVKAPKGHPITGNKKILTTFLLFPMTALNPETRQSELRWLETATYLAEVVVVVNGITDEYRRWFFEPMRWLDSPERIEEAKKIYHHDLRQYRLWEEGSR